MKKSLKNLLSLNRNSDSLLIRNIILVFLILLFNLSIESQNLVPNGSFESHTVCPNWMGQLSNATPWFSPTGTSTDLYDSCSSTRSVPFLGLYAHDGWAFIGMNLYSDENREYAQVKLKDSLYKDRCYYVEFYAICENLSPQAVNNVGANFSKLSYTTYPFGPNIPTPIHITNYGNPVIKDTNNWVKISGLYTATGGENYITIGNFKDNQNTNADTMYWTPLSADGSYYFIDAVSVTSVNPSGTLLWSYRDTTITVGDSVYIGNSMGGTFSSNWYTSSGTFIKQDAGIYVRPVTTSSYIVQYTVCGVSRSDTVKVTVLPGVGINKLYTLDYAIKIFPNPAKNQLSLQSKTNNEELEISICEVSGKILLEKKLKISAFTANLDLELSNGVYFVSIKNSADEKVTKKLVISQ